MKFFAIVLGVGCTVLIWNVEMPAIWGFLCLIGVVLAIIILHADP